MNTTWKELQETCLRKMFSLDGAELVRDNNTESYMNSMPAAANEAMLILATAGRYWQKCLCILHRFNFVHHTNHTHFSAILFI